MATSKKLTSLEGTAFDAGAADWGSIGGSIANQTDLGAALDAKTTTIPPTTVALLPDGELGDITIATDGRKSGETAGNGTGVPVWSDGTSWLTFYGNTAVEA